MTQVKSSETYDIMEEAAPLYALALNAPFLKPDQDDSSIVLLATSLIEKFLRLSLLSLFKGNVVSKTMLSNVFEGRGPLASFSAKIEVCLGLGSISPDVREDLKIVNNIRNKFAHSPIQLRLKDFDACLSLKLKPRWQIQDDCKHREMFKQSCLGIIGHLSTGTLYKIAASRFLASNTDGVMREYESMMQALETEEEAAERSREHR